MVGDVLADRYELEELVGSGGMSSVYRAHDRVLDRRVALKVLHPQLSTEREYVDRFLREARTVASLSHPNVVTVIDRGEHAGRQFIVFEYIDGENLKRLIERGGPAPVERALELAIQIARGLSAAHEKGLVHRDVKPQNVLLNGNGQAKVTDFGIARSIDVKQGMTQTGTVLGTSDYIAPEQAQGRRVDEQTDVYSLGVVLYELLTGEVPFAGENFVAVAMRHINEPPPSVLERRPEVPLRVAEAVDRALAKEPGDRFPTMAAFGRELQACLEEVRAGESGAPTMVIPGAAPSASVPPRVRAPRPEEPAAPPRPRRRIPTALLVVPAVLVALAVALALVLTRNDGGGGGGGGTAGAGTSQAVALSGVGALDPPPGDGKEHGEDAPLATDGNQATFWETQDYRSSLAALGKTGVGVVLDAGGTVTLHRVTVTTDTLGFSATIRAGDSPTGPFHDVSDSKAVAGTTTFDLHDAKARYFVVWITDLGGLSQAHVNEVTAN
jgi:tRNA A-37 threonylcarbamoyl transferase component Bud32